ncbi:hypothetical protein LSTR_LSTR013627 [Laodelphax striatellus]|uniref:Uncharacterized protein n=1 Tax=Laodelphax striatellus TaxID=195883 RepID=A0A482XWD4_LAOST|nr:hypothetical protein LSTR_LSTR013627 [Laodelphax striatellus]
MKILFHFPALLLFHIFDKCVAGRDIGQNIPPSNDFPYILNDMDADWVWISNVLRNYVEVDGIKQLLTKYQPLVRTSDHRTALLLRQTIIQHCVYHIYMSNFQSQEIFLLKEAVKLGLEAGQARVKNLVEQSEEHLESRNIVTKPTEETMGTPEDSPWAKLFMEQAEDQPIHGKHSEDQPIHGEHSGNQLKSGYIVTKPIQGTMGEHAEDQLIDGKHSADQLKSKYIVTKPIQGTTGEDQLIDGKHSGDQLKSRCIVTKAIQQTTGEDVEDQLIDGQHSGDQLKRGCIVTKPIQGTMGADQENHLIDEKIGEIVAEIALKAELRKQFNKFQLSEQAKYIIHASVMEYITLSLSDIQISNFLVEVFLLLDKGKVVSGSNVHHEELTREPPLHFEVYPYLGASDGVNLMKKYFHGIDPQLDGYLARSPRNIQLIAFQNKLIKNHCIQKQRIDALNQESKDVFVKTQQLILAYFANNLRILTGEVFDYVEDQCNSNVFKSISLDCLIKDAIFSITNSYRALNDENLELKNVLTMRIEEMIEIAVIADVDMYLALKYVYEYIDNKFNSNDIKAILGEEDIKWEQRRVYYK